MAVRPPKGKAPATARQGAPGWVLAAVVVFALVGVAAVVALDISGALDALGPVRYALTGLVGALAVVGYRHFTYSAGPDWFRRGDSWVDTGRLTHVAVDGDAVRLRDDRRAVRVPVAVLRGNAGLYAALAGPVRARAAVGAGVEPAAAWFFGVQGA